MCSSITPAFFCWRSTVLPSNCEFIDKTTDCDNALQLPSSCDLTDVQAAHRALVLHVHYVYAKLYRRESSYWHKAV
jgi:hypothetical protein